MNLTRCPVCHSKIHLEHLIQDEAGRNLLALVSRLPDWFAMPLVSYLGLFRSATRDLANDRALRLAREVLEISDCSAMSLALAETVEAMRQKQIEQSFKPMVNHNYLKRVFESKQPTQVSRDVPPTIAPVAASTTSNSNGPTSQTGKGLLALESMKSE